MKRPAKKMLLCVFTALLLAASMLFVACSDNPEPQKPEPGAESGVYYYDSTDGEYLLTLSDGDKFALDMGEGRKYSGTYSLKGEKLELSFATPVEDANISATYKQETVTLTFGTSTMRFIRKVEYKVTFDSNGGSAVAEQTVINGKTLNKPADPVKENSTFIWWYTDNNKFENPFAFGSRPVTAPLTLYARWAGMPTEKEYTVKFDLNYEDSNNNIPAVTTIAGKLYITTPAPEREGYVFNGWYVSTAHSGDKLSYPVTENIIFEENTTVYACWSAVPTGSKLATPKVTVSANGVSWERVSSAAQYAYKITNPDNTVSQNGQGSTPSTSVEYNFDKPGEYKVEITAVHSNTNNNSDTAVRYYTGKSLARVSRFTVTDGNVLTFDKVANATGYRITVVCGNSAHTHIDENISDIGEGDTVSYNFAGCPMIEGGIRFTVTAFATGYVSSISETFVFDRTLAAVEGLAFNAETSVLTWNAVDNAEQYEVRVANNAAVKVTGTEYSLKEFAAGEYTVSVKPVAFGYNSPAAATLEFEKVGKAAPANVKLEGTTLKWDKVGEENNYTVLFNGEEISVNGATELDLAEKLTAVADGTECSVAVKVAGDGNAYSRAIVGKKGVLEGKIAYADGAISWQPAFGATEYEISINGETAQTTANTSFDLNITAAETCEITVKVSGAQNGISVSVVFRQITLNVNGGNAPDKTEIYLADGDKLQLPAEIVKDNYVFAGWYDSANGPEGNGRKYESGEIFRGAQNIELYAYYTPKPFTVRFDLGDEGSGSIADATVYYNENFTLPVPAPKDSVMSFTGWYSAAGGTGTQYTDASGVGIGTWKYTDSDAVTLYAGWMRGAFNFELNQTETGYKLTAGEKAGSLTELTVPEEYNGLPVLEVGDFRYGYNLKTVNIPNTVTYIAQTAFANCSKLTAINIKDAGAETPTYISENGIVYLPADAQKGLTKSYYILPTAVTGEFTVDKEINNIAAGAFSSTSITSITIHADVTYVAPEAFANCKQLETVTFQNPEQGAESKELTIGAKAFAKCDSLTTVNLSSRKIKDGLPLNRYTLSGLVGSSGNANKTVYDDIDGIKHTSVSPEITNAITDIFYTGYVKEEIATDGNKVTTVIKRAPNSLQNINVDAANPDYKSIDGILYNKSGDTLLYCPEANAATGGTLNLPADVRTIANGAFMHNTAIKTVNIHALGVNIGEIAFYASAVENVTFAGSNTAQPVVLGEYAFRESNIKKLTFAENSKVTEIGDGAFFDCKSFSSEVKIPASVATIGDRAFARSAITKLSYADGAAPTLGNFMIYGCSSLVSYEVGAKENELPNFEGCTGLTEIKISDGNPNFSTDDLSVIYNKDKTKLLYYPVFRNETEYTVIDSVKEIGAGVFKGNSKLQSVIFGTGLEIIGNEAFSECSNLTSVTFNEGGAATTLAIGERAFYYTALTALVTPARTESIGKEAFLLDPNGNPLKSLTLNEGLETIGENAFQYAAITSLSIPNTVKTIDNYAFNRATIAEIVIPNSVTYIGAVAFGDVYSNRTGVTRIEFEDGGTEDLTIGEYAFARLRDMTSVSLPDRLKQIGDRAFYYCNTLTSARLPADLVYDKDSLFYKCSSSLVVTGGKQIPAVYEDNGDGTRTLVEVKYTGENSFEIAADVTAIGDGAFYGLSEITTVTFASRTLELTIGSEAFSGSGITSIALPAQTKSIGSSAFANCVNLASVTLPATITSIPSYAFSYCSKLTDFDFGNIITIGSSAFRNCGFTSVDLSSVTSIGSNAFANCASLAAVTLPATLEYDGTVFAGCSADIQITGGIKKVAEYRDNGDGTRTLVKFLDSAATAFEVPSDVTAIADNAFEGMSSLQSVTFQDRTRDLTIGYQAFYQSGITSITIPASVTTIGAQAFRACKSLQTVVFSENCKLTELPGGSYGVFESCSALENITLHEGLITIGGSTFYGTKASVIVIPTSVKTIADSFALPPSATVYIPDCVDEDAAKARFGSMNWKGSRNIIYNRLPSTTAN